jgi:anaerobic magnesium-protoporphyrin IX monomethyl ester cyclase
MSYKRVLILNFPKIIIDAPPLAPALLSAICEKNNIEHDFIDCNLEFYQQLDHTLKEEILGLYSEQLIETLPDAAQFWVDQYFFSLKEKCQNYDLIAISVFSVHSVNLVHEFLSKNRSQIKADIVVGGAGISSPYGSVDDKNQFYQILYQKELVDYWILGEAEIGFKNLLLKQFPNESINNIDFNRLDSFDQVPIPNFDKFKINDYVSAGKKIISAEGSRGCVKRCTFCDIQKTWGTFKYKDGKKLADELLILKDRYNIDHFWFNDSLINGSLKAFRDFITHLANRPKDKCFTWSSQAIVRQRSSKDEEDFRLLKDSGCETLAVGIESFSQPVRWHMGKKFTDSDLDHFLNLAQKYSVNLFLLLIVGYPTETQKDFEQGLRQLEKYQNLADDGTISGLRIGGTMHIGPNLPIYDMRNEIGLTYPSEAKNNHVTWTLGENTLKKRVEWRIQFENYARSLGYNCADKEMQVEQILLKFLKNLN